MSLRWAAVASLVSTGAIHAALVPAHLREAPYAGVLFIALSVAVFIVAVLLARRDHELAWPAAALISIAALLAYVVSRSVGLPSLGDDVGDWLNPLGIAAVASETATVLIWLRRQVACRPVPMPLA